MEGYILQIQKIWKTPTSKLILLMTAMFIVFIALEKLELPSEISPNEQPKVLSTSNYSVNTTESLTDDNSDESKETFDYQEGTSEEFTFDVGNGMILKKNKDGHITVENISDNSTSPSVITEPKKEPTQAKVDLKVSNSTTTTTSTVVKKEKKKKNKKQVFKPMSFVDMERTLQEKRASPDLVEPSWPSLVDQQLLDAKAEIEDAPFVSDNQGLYPPIFRNFSAFIRGYELMEEMLKVYIYKEGDQPIFHKPFFTGIYSSEGWFMKQLEDNKQFVTNDASKAHMFYMPFSSRNLQEVLYVENSHSHKNLIAHLKSYVSTISSKYRFWNRTQGADHFLAGCHDWATHETAQSMENSIRALCNADVLIGFRIGKDVSLPETNVPNGRNPLQNVGGKLANQRTKLAFFAGQMHGYLRPILLQHWENKDATMLITGPIPHRLRTEVNVTTLVEDNDNTSSKKKRKRRKRRKKMNKYGFMTTTITTYPYMNHMKDSKYCICPRGYEVNSPRVVEAIFYGCVPVIIADNFVPPLFEVFEWSQFSVILPEKDIGRLRDILLGIPEFKYFKLERGVREVRRHFLWNRRPEKYDLFHMILYNVWINRIYQVKES